MANARFHRMIRPFRPVGGVLLLAALIAMATGCAGNRDANGGGNDNGNGGRMKQQAYSDDGYMGWTSSYPKIPGRHFALNYPSDARMMRESIRNVRGVAGSNITFQGADAYVTVKLQPGLAPREIPTVERQAASVLRFNFPRYNVHVTSSR